MSPPHSISRVPASVPAGLLLVDKPVGVTSHDVVAAVRRKLSLRRIGHTGTLDPMAQGLLVLLLGPATKHQQAFQGHEKSYEAVIRLGTRTDTGDAEGQPVCTAPVPPLDRDGLADLLRSFEGLHTQTPPAYSAVKVRGRPAYWWARRHHPLELAARQVRLCAVSLVDATPDTITFNVRCSAGTYVRVLAESIAERLGTVGHLIRLIRQRVEPWRLDDAVSLKWIQQASPEDVLRHVQPLPTLHPPQSQRHT